MLKNTHRTLSISVQVWIGKNPRRGKPEAYVLCAFISLNEMRSDYITKIIYLSLSLLQLLTHLIEFAGSLPSRPM